jgi:acetyl esterase
MSLPLDPVIAAVLAQAPVHDFSVRTPENARRDFLALVVPASDDVAREDLVVEGVPARRYTGTSERTVVFLHGGGWVIGSIETHDRLAAALVQLTGATVLSVDYALAPECPFPAGLEDALTVLRWAVSELGADRVAVAGDSAGGNLAAAAAQVLRDEGTVLRAQLLLYPCTDARGRYAEPVWHASVRDNATGFGLSGDAMRWFIGHYLQDANPDDPRVSPLAGDLAGLPPAVVSVAEYDPLRDEGVAYARALEAAGTRATLLHGHGLVHGFPAYAGISALAARETQTALAAFAELLG